MKVLVVGKGGREHALCWKLKQSPKVSQVFCAPGNAGTALDVKNVAIESHDIRALAAFAKREEVALTVAGPEEPLVAGIVDLFRREGLRIFGPSREAAELEGSKAFAKEVMRHSGVPTADYRIFDSATDAERYVLSREVQLSIRAHGHPQFRGSQLCRSAAECLEAIDRMFGAGPKERGGFAPSYRARAVEIAGRNQKVTFPNAAEAREHVLRQPLDLVVKADGLAAGKGVFVCSTIKEALEAVRQAMVKREFGKAGDKVLIEERMIGVETSVLALTDGRTIVPLASSQDHKRALDDDQGPNTGGMGAYSPADDLLTPDVLTMIDRDILVPTVHRLKRSRKPFKGLLYAGLMLSDQGPKVLEFNVRFGDPECQAILMRLKTDFFDVLNAVVDERLDEIELEWDSRASVCVVMASEGYPGAYERDKVIFGLEDVAEFPDVKVFHAGTRQGAEGRILTDGGRVLNVTALGDDLRQARDRAYQAVMQIRFQGARFRNDIAAQGLRHLEDKRSAVVGPASE